MVSVEILDWQKYCNQLDMHASLIEALQQVEDFRSARGRRYPLWVVLLLVILGMMSQCQGYCSLETFAQRHKDALIAALGLPLKRLPSDSTFRLILQQLDYRQLMRVFNQWAQQSIELEPGSGLSIDGKAIAGTLVEHQGSQQNFVSLVSLYCQQQGVVLRAQAFENQHQSELEVVQQLLGALHLDGHIVTLDALHAQKKQLRRSSSTAMTL
jgi:DDE_Tnp_1-associated